MYSEAPEVAALAETVMDQYSNSLQDVYGQPCRIKYLFKNSKKSTYLGKCSRATGKWSHLTNKDYIIEIFLPWWKNADENAKKALLFHELRHIKLVEKETPEGDLEITWRIRPHEAEMFVDDISLFGTWLPVHNEILEVCKELS